jgi:hypothetical protein
VVARAVCGELALDGCDPALEARARRGDGATLCGARPTSVAAATALE